MGRITGGIAIPTAENARIAAFVASVRILYRLPPVPGHVHQNIGLALI